MSCSIRAVVALTLTFLSPLALGASADPTSPSPQSRDVTLREARRAVETLSALPETPASVATLGSLATRLTGLGLRKDAVSALQRGVTIAEKVAPGEVSKLLAPLGDAAGAIENHKAAEAAFKKLLGYQRDNPAATAQTHINILKAQVRSNSDIQALVLAR